MDLRRLFSFGDSPRLNDRGEVALPDAQFTERIPTEFIPADGGGFVTGRFACPAPGCGVEHHGLPISERNFSVTCPVKYTPVFVTDNKEAFK